MKKYLSKIVLTLVLSLSIILGSTMPILAFDRDENAQVTESVAKLISFYEKGYRVDTLRELQLLKELGEAGTVSKESSIIWEEILDSWDWIEKEMVENIGVAPDGLKNPSKHAFIVLGFALNDDGTMTDELVGRLEVAKASALKYPESYILVTGGVEKNGWTEGRRMRDWLVANGIDVNRIIVEEQAPDTAGNATNSFNMLYNDYDVETVSIITSQYHLRRASILYKAESLLRAYELDKTPITFLGSFNAGWKHPTKDSENLGHKANSLRTVARVPNVDITNDHAKIVDITLTKPKMNDIYTAFTEYNESISARLEIIVDGEPINVLIDITKYVQVEYDFSKPGWTPIKVTYTENGTDYICEYNGMVVLPEVLEHIQEFGKTIDKYTTEMGDNFYTADSYGAYSKARLEYHRFYFSGVQSVDELIPYEDAISLAFSQLELRGDTTGLVVLIEKAEKLAESNFDRENWNHLQEKIAYAKTMINNENASEAMVKLAEQELNDAMLKTKKTEVLPTTGVRDNAWEFLGLSLIAIGSGIFGLNRLRKED